MFKLKLFVIFALFAFIVCALAQGDAEATKEVAEFNSELAELKEETARWRWHDDDNNNDQEEAVPQEDEEEARAKRAASNPCKPPSSKPSASTSSKSSSTSAKSSSTSAKSSSTSAKSSSTSAKSSSTTGSRSSSTSSKSATTGTKSATTGTKSSTTSGKSSTTTTGKSSSSTSSKSSTSSSSSSGSNYGLCDVVPASAEPLKMLLPLYVYPGSAWDNIVTAASSIDIIAIINPNSGPTSSPDSSYTTYMNKLNNAGVEQIGYVYTSYGDRALSTVKADIDTYASKYPHIIGIFFDEASNSASDIPYYTELYQYVLSKGFVHSILNPGTQPTAGYVAISTTIVIFENYGTSVTSSSYSSFVTCASSASQKAGYKYKFAGIAHTASQSSMASFITNFQNKGMGMVYVTDGAGGCCTYNNLVSYFSAEVSAIKSLNN